MGRSLQAHSDSECVVSNGSTYVGDAAAIRNERGLGVPPVTAGLRLQQRCAVL
jgi:hypothetical protein